MKAFVSTSMQYIFVLLLVCSAAKSCFAANKVYDYKIIEYCTNIAKQSADYEASFDESSSPEHQVAKYFSECLDKQGYELIKNAGFSYYDKTIN